MARQLQLWLGFLFVALLLLPTAEPQLAGKANFDATVPFVFAHAFFTHTGLKSIGRLLQRHPKLPPRPLPHSLLPPSIPAIPDELYPYRQLMISEQAGP